jgi:hypothetical protein
VRDDDERRMLEGLGNDALQRGVGDVVERRGRLVEREDRGALGAQQHAREAEELALADGERLAKLGDGREQPAVEARDRVLQPHALERAPQRRVGVGARSERARRVQVGAQRA